MARIDGVQVSEGGNVKWGLVASLLVSAPLYAVQEGWIDVVQLSGDALGELITGPATFVADWLSLLLGGGSRAVSASWWSFLDGLTALSGPFAWPFVVLGVLVTLAILSWGVRRIGV
jgi:hypothetical protein